MRDVDEVAQRIAELDREIELAAPRGSEGNLGGL